MAWPSKLDGVQAGDAYSIYVDIPEGKPIKVTLDGKPVELGELRRTERPLVERAVSQAKIASMLEREIISKEDMKKSIVSLAVQQRIMTPYTAMLVLETEADYARFHIDRKSLRDVLAKVRAAGKEVVVYLPLGGGTKEVIVASGASKVFLGPSAQLAALGFQSRTRYLKNALDKAGIVPEVYACGEYKSAGETLVRDSMSDAQREQVGLLLDRFDAALAKRSARRGKEQK